MANWKREEFLVGKKNKHDSANTPEKIEEAKPHIYQDPLTKEYKKEINNQMGCKVWE